MSPFRQISQRGPTIFPLILSGLSQMPSNSLFLQKLHVAFYDDNFRAQRRVALCFSLCICAVSVCLTSSPPSPPLDSLLPILSMS